MIIPSVPPEAAQKAIAWRQQGGIAFHRILEPLPLQCKNCGDTQLVYLAFCKGASHKYPHGSKPGLWFDGDESARKGWYSIEQTVAWPCPKCSNIAK